MMTRSKQQDALEALWSYSGPRHLFASEALRTFCHRLEAASAVWMTLHSDAGEPTWVPSAFWPEAEETKQRLASQRDLLRDMAEQTLQSEGSASLLVQENETFSIGALRLESDHPSREHVVIFLAYGETPLRDPGKRECRLLADTLLIYGADPFEMSSPSASHSTESESEADSRPLPSALRVSLAVDEHSTFLAAAMRVCNEVAALSRSQQVSLGMTRGAYLRLEAGSHSEKVNRKTEWSRILLSAMEECRDQDDEILWPGDEQQRSIDREHARFAEHTGTPCLVSIPLRQGDEPDGVLTLERLTPFSREEVHTLRLIADLVAPRLFDLQARDRWVGVRMAKKMRKGFSWVLGPEHTWAKVAVLGVAALVAASILIPIPHRVEAPFTLRPDQMQHLPAPFEGYLLSAGPEVGDAVKQNEILARMDPAELELSKSELEAAIQRHVSEAQLARNQSSPAEVRIALSQADQARAQLEMIEFQLRRSVVRAPRDGFIVRGDLDNRLGAPISKGEALYTISGLDDLYAECRVDERDIHLLDVGHTGTLAFASRPEERVSVEVVAIEPLAVPEQEGNRFIVRTRILDEPELWWRPGMTGRSRLEVGTTHPLYLFTHRAIDTLRLRFWF